LRQFDVLGRVTVAQPGPKDGDGAATFRECRRMRSGVNPRGEAREDAVASIREIARKTASGSDAVSGGSAAAHDRDRPRVGGDQSAGHE
jgi:hypothetical protein